MFDLNPAATREERRAIVQAQRQDKFNEHYESVIDRAPDLVFLKSRHETEQLVGAPKLKNFHLTLWKRHLSDLEVEVAQKMFEEQRAGLNVSGSSPAPDGPTAVSGVVTDVYRKKPYNPHSYRVPPQAMMLVRDDRGFVARVSCPAIFISGAPAIGIEGVGTLNQLPGWRVSFDCDLTPSDIDDTVCVQRKTSAGRTTRVLNPKLLGKQFEFEE
jgi:hypothetical protein